LEPLARSERCQQPQVGGARQNAFCERQDAFHVEFIELTRVTVDPRERELPAICRRGGRRLDVDRALEEERLVEAVQFS